MPTLHINVAHISISQAYYFIAIYYQSDHSIPLLYKNLILRNIISTSISRHTDNTQALRPPPATILPVSSQLDLRFNSTELFKIIARAVLLSQLNCIFLNHQP